LVEDHVKKENELSLLVSKRENEASFITKAAEDGAEIILSEAKNSAAKIISDIEAREASVSEREQWLKNKVEILKSIKLELEVFYNKKIPNMVIE
jgi:vacuolar-type H+-ATPase subunit E/Vma4